MASLSDDAWIATVELVTGNGKKRIYKGAVIDISIEHRQYSANRLALDMAIEWTDVYPPDDPGLIGSVVTATDRATGKEHVLLRITNTQDSSSYAPNQWVNNLEEKFTHWDHIVRKYDNIKIARVGI